MKSPVSCRPARSLAATLVACSILIVGGCASFRGYPAKSGDASAELDQLKKYFQPAIMTEYDGITDPDAQRAKRNEIIDGRVRAIDLNYGLFCQALNADSHAINVGSDMAVLAVNGAGAIVKYAGTKTILATVSGAIVGSRGAISKEVFYDKTMPVLLAQMEALRQQQLVVIEKGKTLDTTSYTLNKALSDVEKYYLAGTIPQAILQSTAASGSQVIDANAKLNSIVDVKYNAETTATAPRNLLQTWLLKEPANYGALQDWLKAQTPSVTEPASIWTIHASTADLEKAIAALNVK